MNNTLNTPKLNCIRCGKERRYFDGHFLSCECYWKEAVFRYGLMPIQSEYGPRTYHDDN